MLLRDTSIKERKEKVIINHRKIQIDNINLIKRQEENNQHQKTIINNKEEEEEEEESDSIYRNDNAYSSCEEYKTDIEVIPELQINELFFYWINLPNTQQLIHNYLKKFGLSNDILNNLTNSYFIPYIQRLEASERKKNDLSNLQKLLFSINRTNSNLFSNNLNTETETELDYSDTSEASSYNSNNLSKIKQKSIEIKGETKTLPRERRKVRKLYSATNTYINRLNTPLHKKEQREFKETEISNKITKEYDKNSTELTEIITEKDTINKENNNYHYNKATEKAMENNVLVEQINDELNKTQNNEKIIQEDENTLGTKAKKYDSGVDISFDSKPNTIPKFYFPKGRPVDNNIKLKIDEQLNNIELLFKTNDNQLNEQEFWRITEICELPRYISAALFKKVANDPEDISQVKVSFEDFKSIWIDIKSNNFDLDSLIFSILKPTNREKLRGKEDYLIQDDFFVVINDVVQYHPGLEFLSNMPIFQNRYIETVISRLFYSKPRNWNERMTLNEFRKVKFTQKLINLQDEDDDININRDIFSYKHFYVIYCKFWELDKDHDMKINRNELAKYDQFSMTPIMIDRVIEGYGKVTSNDGKILKSGWRDKIDDYKLNNNQSKIDNFSTLQEAFRNVSIKNKNLILNNFAKDYNNEDDPNIMLYKDFIWFILSAEDKGTTQAIEYWFRCLDLDGDGIISVFEIEQFWIEQYQRMIEWRTVDIWSFNDFLCYLLDMIQPENKNIITLADLKRSKNTPLFFDMLFDIKKYEMHLRCMDPLFREANEVWIVEGISNDSINTDEEEKKIKLEGWEKFAERTYEQLAYEEMQAQQYQLSCQNYQMHKGKLVDTTYRHHRNSILDEDPFGPEIIDDFLEEDEEYSICSEEEGEDDIPYSSFDHNNSNHINRNYSFDNYQENENKTIEKKIC